MVDHRLEEVVQRLDAIERRLDGVEEHLEPGRACSGTRWMPSDRI
jgi:hypothetical protein